MSKSERYPSYATCVAEVLRNSKRPLSVDFLLSEVASQRPLGKGARSAVYRAINKLFQAVPVAPGRYGWLSHLMDGAIFRHPLTSEEVRRGYIMLDELEHTVFFPQFFQSYRPDDREVTVELFGGPTIQATATIERKTWSLRLGSEFVDWVDELGGQNRDDLLISARDTLAGHYDLRLNLREMRDERDIEQRNIQLSLLAEKIVTEDKQMRAAVPTWELVARMIARGFFSESPPPDDLHYVLHEFSMLRFTDGLGYQLDMGTDGESGAAYLANTDRFDDSSHSSSSTLSESTHPNDRPVTDLIDELANASESGEEFCAGYEQYLLDFYAANHASQPLSHEDFHMLEAELEMLVHLAGEFGRLLPEQQERQEHLAARLFIDPNSFAGTDWDAPDDPDLAEPPFWEN